MRIKASSLFIIALATSLVSAEDVSPIPTNHPIYQPPFPLYPISDGWHYERVPVWKFELSQKQFLLGEPISGRIIVENPDREMSYSLSPPFHGCLVSTISIWEDVNTGATSQATVKLREVYRINHGYRIPGHSLASEQYQGKPIALKPSQKYETYVWLNVYQPPLQNDCQGGWYAGIGFSKPGRYKFYVKYMSVETQIPFAARKAKEDYRPPVHELGDPIPAPRRPIVLGPFEVEILPLPSEVNQPLSEMLSEWEKNDRRPGDRGVGYETEGITKLLKNITPLGDKVQNVADSLRLTQIRASLGEQLGLEKKNPTVLAKLLGDTQTICARLNPSPIKDAYLFTECLILEAQGKLADALRVAATIDNADAKAFIADRAL